MTEEDLVAKIRQRATGPKRQNSIIAGFVSRGGHLSNDALKLCPPATVESFEKPKTKWVSHYPPCWNVLIYMEVGNGGLGPGYGLYGLSGGFAEDLQGLTLPDLYLTGTELRWIAEEVGLNL